MGLEFGEWKTLEKIENFHVLFPKKQSRFFRWWRILILTVCASEKKFTIDWQNHWNIHFSLDLMVNSISQENFCYELIARKKKFWLSSLLFIGNNYDNIARVWLVRVIETYSKSDFGPPKKFCIKQKQHCNHINKPIVFMKWKKAAYEKWLVLKRLFCCSKKKTRAKHTDTCRFFAKLNFKRKKE